MFTNEKFEYTLEEQAKIADLRKLVEDCSELQIGTEDVLLSKFLNFSQWNVSQAFESLNRYYDFKFKHPDWVASHSVEYYHHLFNVVKTKFVMPKPDKEGRPVFVTKMVDVFDNYPNYHYDLIAMDDLIFESLCLIPAVQKNGVTVIFDFSGITKNFIKSYTPNMSKMINKKNDILPIRNRIVHFIQKGFLIHTVSTMIMPFISKELKEKIFIHDGKNYDKLREMIGTDGLPAEYGGPAENVLDEKIIYDHLMKHSDYLKKIQEYKRTSALDD